MVELVFFTALPKSLPRRGDPTKNSFELPWQLDSRRGSTLVFPFVSEINP